MGKQQRQDYIQYSASHHPHNNNIMQVDTIPSLPTRKSTLKSEASTSQTNATNHARHNRTMLDFNENESFASLDLTFEQQPQHHHVANDDDDDDEEEQSLQSYTIPQATPLFRRTGVRDSRSSTNGGGESSSTINTPKQLSQEWQDSMASMPSLVKYTMDDEEQSLASYTIPQAAPLFRRGSSNNGVGRPGDSTSSMATKLFQEWQDSMASMPSLVSYCTVESNSVFSQVSNNSMNESTNQQVDLSSVLEEIEELDVSIHDRINQKLKNHKKRSGSKSSHGSSNNSNNKRDKSLPQRAHSTTSILSAKSQNYIPDVTPLRESRWMSDDQPPTIMTVQQHPFRHQQSRTTTSTANAAVDDLSNVLEEMEAFDLRHHHHIGLPKPTKQQRDWPLQRAHSTSVLLSQPPSCSLSRESRWQVDAANTRRSDSSLICSPQMPKKYI